MLIRGIPLVLAALTLVAIPATGVAQDPPVTEPPEPAILAALEASGNHTMFLAAIRTAGLEETLNGDGPFTVFAPTDAAFQKLPEERRTALLADQEALRDLIQFHIAADPLPEEITEPASVATLQGSNIEVVRDGESIQVRAPAPARVAEEDAPAQITATSVGARVTASNGVVYAVDTVLIIEG